MHEAGVRGRLRVRLRGRLRVRLRASGGSTTLTLSLSLSLSLSLAPALTLNQVPTLVTVGADDLIVAPERVRAAFGSWQVRVRVRVGV